MKTNTWFCNTSGFNMRKNVKKIAWEVCKSASSGVRRGRGGEQRPPWSSLGRRAPAPGGGWAAGRGRQVGGGQDPGRHRGGDLLRSVPFIMGGHLNMDFFQVVFAQVFDTNPKSICLMMIHKHSGRAPRPFQHLLLAMSALEMSGHDTKRLSWFF